MTQLNVGAQVAVAVLSAALGGVVGGVIVRTWGADDDEPSRRARVTSESLRHIDDSDAVDPDEAESEVADRLRTLEHRIALLNAALQKKSHPGGSTEDSGETSEETGSTARESTDVADPVFEAAVLDIVDRERERKDEEQAVWRKKLQTERSRRMASELSSSLELSSQQQAEIAQAVTDYFEQMRSWRDSQSPDQPVTRKERRELRDRMNQEADNQLKKILSPAQFEKYEALDADEKLGFGRRNQGEQSSRPVSSPRP